MCYRRRPMRLKDWLASQPYGEISRLGRVTGLAINTIRNVRDGAHTPNYATAKAISDATRGAVTLIELFAPPPKRARVAKRRTRARVQRRKAARSSMRAAAAA
jgi:hypothetical protein